MSSGRHLDPLGRSLVCECSDTTARHLESSCAGAQHTRWRLLRVLLLWFGPMSAHSGSFRGQGKRGPAATKPRLVEKHASRVGCRCDIESRAILNQCPKCFPACTVRRILARRQGRARKLIRSSPAARFRATATLPPCFQGIYCVASQRILRALQQR
jgi:hypothetical protein